MEEAKRNQSFGAKVRNIFATPTPTPAAKPTSSTSILNVFDSKPKVPAHEPTLTEHITSVFDSKPKAPVHEASFTDKIGSVFEGKKKEPETLGDKIHSALGGGSKSEAKEGMYNIQLEYQMAYNSRYFGQDY